MSDISFLNVDILSNVRLFAFYLEIDPGLLEWIVIVLLWGLF